jgi:hypothetical protein
MKFKFEKTSTTKRIRDNYKGPPVYTVQGEKHYDFRMSFTVAIGTLELMCP